MICYLDTSALVKRYIDESQSQVVADIADAMAVSEIARVEVASALWKRARTNPRAAPVVPTLLQAFHVDIAGQGQRAPRVQLVRLDHDTVAEAARLVARHDLGSLDALHVATADRIRRAIDPWVIMVAFDRRLRAAAGIEGFPLLPATLDDELN